MTNMTQTQSARAVDGYHANTTDGRVVWARPEASAEAPLWCVEVTRTFETHAWIRAATPQEALALVQREDLPLPDRSQWEGLKDWTFRVSDPTGAEVIDVDGNASEGYEGDEEER